MRKKITAVLESFGYGNYEGKLFDEMPDDDFSTMVMKLLFELEDHRKLHQAQYEAQGNFNRAQRHFNSFVSRMDESIQAIEGELAED